MKFNFISSPKVSSFKIEYRAVREKIPIQKFLLESYAIEATITCNNGFYQKVSIKCESQVVNTNGVSNFWYFLPRGGRRHDPLKHTDYHHRRSRSLDLVKALLHFYFQREVVGRQERKRRAREVALLEPRRFQAPIPLSLNVQLHEYHCDTCKLSRNCCLNHSPNLEDMLAPPSILLHSNSLDHEDEKGKPI